MILGQLFIVADGKLSMKAQWLSADPMWTSVSDLPV